MTSVVASDERILRAVRMEIELACGLTADQIDVSVLGGRVTVSGIVRSQAQKAQVGRAAKRQHGVLGLTNRLRVDEAALASIDDAVASAARGALEQVCGVGNSLGVRVYDRDIHVSGELDSRVTHAQLLESLVAVPGARRIFDDTMSSKQTPADDRTLRDRVLEAVAKCKAISPEQVGVAVRNGVVELSGMLGTPAQRTAVLDGVLSVKGISTVVDAIGVEGPDFVNTDYGIAADVRADLLWNSVLATSHASAEVVDGTVILRGTSPNASARDSLRASVSDLTGVRAVDDELRISHSAASED